MKWGLGRSAWLYAGMQYAGRQYIIAVKPRQTNVKRVENNCGVDMPDGASENKVRPTRNSGDAYGYSMYRKLLPKFLDMIDMSLLDDESKEAYNQGLTSRLERISKSADSTKKCSNDNLKSAQTTVSIKHCILTEKVFVR